MNDAHVIYKNEKNPGRIAQITAEIASIGEFVEGALSRSANYYTTRDGIRRKSRPHWKFQTLGGRGKRRWVAVPEKAVARLRELVASGRRYRKLEREYARLVSGETLAKALFGGEKMS